MKALLTALATLLLSTGASAQMIGSPLPEPTISPLEAADCRDFTDLRGQVILLEFFAHW